MLSAFNRLDSDGSGSISPEDLRKAIGETFEGVTLGRVFFLWGGRVVGGLKQVFFGGFKFFWDVERFLEIKKGFHGFFQRFFES